MKITIDVTADDIQRGQRGNCRTCPVARAVAKRVFGRIGVGIALITVGRVVEVSTPDVVVEFIRKFDWKGKADPFSFEIRVPAEIVRPV